MESHMSSTPTSLKSQNMKYIISVLVLDIAAIFFTIYYNDIIPLLKFRLLTLNNGIFATAITVSALLANHLLPRWIKEIIIFLRIKNAQPGCRAFSKRVFKDKRIDVKALQKNLGTFPTTPSEQNALWYKLFKQHESKASIQDAHQMYLLFRDIASITLMIFALFSASLFIYSPSVVTAYIFAGLFAQYFVCMIAAQNSGKSLVDNVLAEASSA